MTSMPTSSHADAEKTERDTESAPDETLQDEETRLEEHYKHQSTSRVALLLSGIFVNIFLVALDRLIISTAIPSITDEFNSLSDVGWYGSAYMLASCSFQLLWGKFYTLYSVRTALLCSIALFELGSAVCGAAPNSTAFIFGRAIAGVGAAGIFSGSIVCTTYSVPLEKRPRILGLFGALFGLASILGPLIGGAFTSHVTWRWCFYINLPFGVVAMILIPLCLRVPDRDSTKLPWAEKLWKLDAWGTSVLIPCVVALLLALQWGGETYAWSNAKIIGLLTVTGVLAIVFIAIQAFLPETATIPPDIFNRRSIMAGCWANVFIGSSMYTFTYFLPIWFQSIIGVSAVASGIRLLPTVLSMVVATILNGFATQKAGYYNPFAIVGCCLMSVGAGLLTTLEVDTAQPRWIGYQIIYGFGLGMVFQAPMLAAQTVLPTADVAIGVALMFFAQLLGAAIFISVGENVLRNQLVRRLSSVTGFDSSHVSSGGATSLIESLPENMRQMALLAYNDSLREVFKIGLIVSCLSVLGICALEWRSVLKKGERTDEIEDNGNKEKGNKAKDTSQG